MTDATAPEQPQQGLNRSIIHAALLSSGYSPAQADTRIIEFERDVRASSPVEELRRLCEQYGLTLAIEAQARPAVASEGLRAEVMEWALQMADEKIAAIVDPWELANAKRLRAALAVLPELEEEQP